VQRLSSRARWKLHEACEPERIATLASNQKDSFVRGLVSSVLSLHVMVEQHPSALASFTALPVLAPLP